MGIWKLWIQKASDVTIEAIKWATCVGRERSSHIIYLFIIAYSDYFNSPISKEYYKTKRVLLKSIDNWFLWDIFTWINCWINLKILRFKKPHSAGGGAAVLINFIIYYYCTLCNIYFCIFFFHGTWKFRVFALLMCARVISCWWKKGTGRSII